MKIERFNCMRWCNQTCRIVQNVLLPRGGNEMLSVTQQHLFCSHAKPGFLVEMCVCWEGGGVWLETG